MSAFDDFVRAVELATGLPGKRAGGETRLLCPAHDDHAPSLDVREADDGRPLARCRSRGCSWEEIAAAIGWSSNSERDEPWTPRGPAVAVYPYVDASGRLLFEVCRTAEKQFPQRRPDPTAKTGWRWNLEGVQRVLFRLPDVLAAAAVGEIVFLCEGEKDVLAVLAAGAMSATCNPGGAGKWRAEYSEALRGADVVVVADKDADGLDHARSVAASLRSVGIEVRVVLPAAGKDASDHLAAGLDLDDLVPLEEEPEAEPDDGPVFVDLRCVVARDVEWIEVPFLPEGELVTNNADGGTGKGLWSVLYAAAISRGEFGERRTVIFAVDEDAFDTVLKPRLLAAGADLETIRAVSWRRRGTNDALVVPDDVPLLGKRIAEMDARFLVIDPLLSHLSAKTNSHIDHEVRLALRPLVALAHETGISILGNGNFTKDKTRGAASSAQGSGAFTNVPRVGLAMAPDDEDPDLRVVEVVKSNIGPKGVGRIYRVEACRVSGLREEVPKLVLEGPATKSVDDLLLKRRQSDGNRIPSELLREIVLRELATGEKSRAYLDEVCEDEIGASADHVYKGALYPLRNEDRVRARKDGLNGVWHWRLT